MTNPALFSRWTNGHDGLFQSGLDVWRDLEELFIITVTLANTRQDKRNVDYVRW